MISCNYNYNYALSIEEGVRTEEGGRRKEEGKG
jgi:hypothetical protein